MQSARRLAVVAVTLLALLVPAGPVVAADMSRLTEVGSGFAQPLYVTNAGDDRLFVVERGGTIRILDPDTGSTSLFLDLTDKVSCCEGERGLLGLAFHPDYATNRLFYVNFTRKSDGATVIAEMRRSATDADSADPATTYFRRVLAIRQPFANHNGGWMAFRGRLLFIAIGDGGGDPRKRAQNIDSLLGKILRINPLDPDGAGTRRYSIPRSNPYVGRRGRDEIWARGLRNPWRCSFDHVADRLWCADVGQNMWEEINRVPATKAGLNYGWPVMEGRHCFRPSSGCNRSGKRLPIAEYMHGSTGCRSVTGGYVSRRPGAALEGSYVFGDFCTGELWAISAGHPAGDPLPEPFDTPYMISSFGEGSDGRLYLVDYYGGRVVRLDES